MIGIGGNRLSAGRQAGLGQTLQVAGGMALVGDVRRPKWMSPYSGAATAAILAAFPNHWSEIARYGLAHPEIVEFVNEDPMLVCSLVDTGVTRSMVTDGSAYSVTNLVPNSTTKVRTAVVRTATGSYKYIFGACGSAGKSSYYFLGANNSSWYNEVRGSNNNFGTATQGVHYELEFTTLETKVDGVTYSHGGTGVLGANTAKMAIGRAINASGGIYDNPWIGSIDYFGVETDGVEVGDFKPFKRNGVYYWLDLVTKELATNVGTWTEQYTDAAGNDVTSRYQQYEL